MQRRRRNPFRPKSQRKVIGFYTKGRGKDRKVIPIMVSYGRKRRTIYRTEHAMKIDKSLKANLTYDIDKYAENPNRYDFKGIDYPSLEYLLFRDIKKGKIKAPFHDEKSFHQYLLKHGFTREEAKKIRIVVKQSAPYGIYASAGKGKDSYYIQLPLDNVKKRGKIEESTLLHELGHIKDMINPKIRSQWSQKDLTTKIEKAKKENYYFERYAKWSDLSSWEIGQPHYDKTEELIANSFSAFHTKELDKSIKQIDEQIKRERKVQKEYEEMLRNLPKQISPVTGKPYSMRGKRAKALRQVIRNQKEAIKQLKEAKKINMEIKAFWKKYS